MRSIIFANSLFLMCVQMWVADLAVALMDLEGGIILFPRESNLALVAKRLEECTQSGLVYCTKVQKK